MAKIYIPFAIAQVGQATVFFSGHGDLEEIKQAGERETVYDPRTLGGFMHLNAGVGESSVTNIFCVHRYHLVGHALWTTQCSGCGATWKRGEPEPKVIIGYFEIIPENPHTLSCGCESTVHSSKDRCPEIDKTLSDKWRIGYVEGLKKAFIIAKDYTGQGIAIQKEIQFQIDKVRETSQ